MIIHPLSKNNPVLKMCNTLKVQQDQDQRVDFKFPKRQLGLIYLQLSYHYQNPDELVQRINIAKNGADYHSYKTLLVAVVIGSQNDYNNLIMKI